MYEEQGLGKETAREAFSAYVVRTHESCNAALFLAVTGWTGDRTEANEGSRRKRASPFEEGSVYSNMLDQPVGGGVRRIDLSVCENEA